MDLRYLEYFTAVCQELNFSRAAAKMGISQPNLSLKIKALEEEVGSELFERGGGGKRIKLTPAGEVLQGYCRGLLNDLKNAYDELSELRHSNRGELSVGVIPSYFDDRLASLVVDLHKEFPSVKLTILSSPEIEKLVLDTTIDIGIGLMPISNDRLTMIPLCREEYGLVVSERNPLAVRKSLSILDLKDLPMVTYPRGYWARDLIEAVCHRRGFSLTTVVESSSNPAHFRLVAENIGVSLEVPYLVQTGNTPSLRFIPIDDDPPVREMAIIHLSNRYLTYAARTFISRATELLAGAVKEAI